MRTIHAAHGHYGRPRGINPGLGEFAALPGDGEMVEVQAQLKGLFSGPTLC